MKLTCVKQTTDYYPFGMVMNQTNSGTGPENKFLYNGKELQDDVIAGTKLDWYDYGARMYDAAVGRWHVVDPLAFLQSNKSPYCYVSNNPANRIDPDGRIDNGIYDWVERDTENGRQIVWDPEVEGPDSPNLQEGDVYIGEEGYGWDEETGEMIHYRSDGKKYNYTPTLPSITVTPRGYAYFTQNPSIHTDNKTGYIWDEKDLAVWNALKDHKSVIGQELRRMVKTGRFWILSASNYWDYYGQTVGALLLFEAYYDMMNVINSAPTSTAKPFKAPNFNPNFNTRPALPKLDINWNSTKPTFNQFRSANKGSFSGYRGRGTNVKAAWQTYSELYGY